MEIVVQLISELVSRVGFPIAMVVILIVTIHKAAKWFATEAFPVHKEFLAKTDKILDNQSEVLEKQQETIERMHDDQLRNNEQVNDKLDTLISVTRENRNGS